LNIGLRTPRNEDLTVIDLPVLQQVSKHLRSRLRGRQARTLGQDQDPGAPAYSKVRDTIIASRQQAIVADQ
jgi:hypothetical protein